MKFLAGRNISFLLPVILLALFFVNSVNAQVEKQIEAIRAEVAAINKTASKYTKSTRSVEDISLEGTEATYYHSAKNLKKITAKIYGETFNATGEFYYANGELIFAFVRRNRYDTQIGLETPPKVASTEEQRFYFAGGKLIRMLIGKKELKPGVEKYSELKDEIISLSGKLKDS